MNLDVGDCTFSGPALPEPFVRFELTAQLIRLGLLGNVRSKKSARDWSALRRQLRSSGGPLSVCNHVIAPLAERLGFDQPARQAEVATREGIEDGGWLMRTPCDARLRAWSFGADTDLDAPHRTGRAYRFSPMRSAQRVLLASGERLALLTDGEQLRLLLCDPARPDSHVAIPLAGSGRVAGAGLLRPIRIIWCWRWPRRRGSRRCPSCWMRRGSVRRASPRTSGCRHAAQSKVSCRRCSTIRPTRASANSTCARSELWEEGLILVYRLLFILKLESASDPARAFSFACTGLWRDALSPNRALGPLVRRSLDQGHDTGRMLEDGLRLVFRMFRDGLSCSELSVTPLGGALFGDQATPLLDRLAWGERAVALLLDRLLWTTPKGRARERVHYGSLDVEDLGRVYEALLELEPGIASDAVSRLRRGKLEVVLGAELAGHYRGDDAKQTGIGVTWIEDIPTGRFFLLTGTPVQH